MASSKSTQSGTVKIAFSKPGKPSFSKPSRPKPSSQSKPMIEEEQQNTKTDDKASMADLVRQRWFPLLGFGGAILCVGYWTASMAMYWKKEPLKHYALGCEPEAPTGRPSIQSPYEFDLHLDKSEWRFGITRLRNELASSARGHVLEVAIGTGRNLEFYDWSDIVKSVKTPEELERENGASSSWLPFSGAKQKQDDKASSGNSDAGAVQSFTGFDISPGMLDIALQRTRTVVPLMTKQIPKKPSFAMMAAGAANSSEEPKSGQHTVPLASGKVRLMQSDVQSGLPPPPPAVQKYDTIFQSFGLCSVRDPVELVSQMAAAVQPDTGRILLLEHGRSVWDIVNGFLDRGAGEHHDRFGCWWNRDIECIVAAAAQRVPGLEIMRLERPGWATMGTHVVVELRVRNDGKTVTAKADPEPEQEQKMTGWWGMLSSGISTKPSGDGKQN
ncbi:hypothetical protein F5Y18DRAFT_418478 [Xylariaceae sp. FL1019]|nr:hypothetical protein F5Y18DRAFT_418478 [Xylariaceae sp. FL1019]